MSRISSHFLALRQRNNCSSGSIKPRNKNVTHGKQSRANERFISNSGHKINDVNNTPVLLRALIDQGSQASFISESASKLLAIPRQKSQTYVTGIGEAGAGSAKGKITITIKPHFKSDFNMDITALIFPKLTKTLPSTTTPKINRWDSSLELADPGYNVPGTIDLIIGADAFTRIIKDGIKN